MNTTEFLNYANSQSKFDIKKCGIYYIYCLVNGRIYIGSSINVRNRFWEHRRSLKASNHKNRHLQRIYDKYGKDSLVYKLIENCEESVRHERENHYISILDKKLRLNLQAVIKNGPVSDETRQRISASHVGRIYKKPSKETIEKVATANRGKKRTKEQKEDLSKAFKKVKGQLNYRENHYKLAISDVVKIRQLFREGLNNPQIAKIFNVSISAISGIRCGRKWKKIPLNMTNDMLVEIQNA